MAHELRELLVCPSCRGSLSWRDDCGACASCGRSYPLTDGIPVLLVEADEHKQRQATWFDEEADEEWEIERPRGAPPLHRWLLGEKFRRSLAALPSIEGWTALAVAGGSGMEAEVLARAGARVVSADISLGAARRALERSRRHGVDLLSIVADAERLPLAEESVDLVYVHDGLHHLADPAAGVAEMARVAARAVSVNEPARASLTRLAVRAGLAVEIEQAGNPVRRLEPEEIAAALREEGFDVVRAERYGMYYRHAPGRAVRALSRRPVLELAKLGFVAANRLAGGLGNKLTVQAVRQEAAARTAPRGSRASASCS